MYEKSCGINNFKFKCFDDIKEDLTSELKNLNEPIIKETAQPL